MTSYKHSASATAIWDSIKKRSVPEVEQWLFEYKARINTRNRKDARLNWTHVKGEHKVKVLWTTDEAWLIKQGERFLAQHKGLKVSQEPVEGIDVLAEFRRREETASPLPRYRQRKYRQIQHLQEIADKEERVYWAKQRRAGL